MTQQSLIRTASPNYFFCARFSAKVVALENEIKNLEDQITDHQLKLTEETSEKTRLQTELERESAKNTFESTRLNTLLKEYEDYEEIKRELEIFKNMELGEDEFSGDQDEKHIPLERVLLDKNKKLENANTLLKVHDFLLILYRS